MSYTVKTYKKGTSSFQRAQQFVLGQFSEHCKAWVYKNKWSKSIIKSCDYLIVSEKVARKTRTGFEHVDLGGFAVIKETRDIVHMDILCSSKHQGRQLMNKVLNLAKTKKKASRPYSNLCGSCMRKKLLSKIK